MNTCKVQELRLADMPEKGHHYQEQLLFPNPQASASKKSTTRENCFLAQCTSASRVGLSRPPALGLELCRSRPSPGQPEDRNSESFLGPMGDTGIHTHSGAETPAPGHKPSGGIPHSRRTRRGQGEKQTDREGMCQDANKAGYPG